MKGNKVNEELTKWLSELGMRTTSNSLWTFALGFFVYTIFLGIVLREPERFLISGITEIYGITSVAQTFVFGFFSAYTLSRWWELRIATGSVAGALSDIAMLLRAYSRQKAWDVSDASKSSIADKLRLAHLFHICDIFRVPSAALAVSRFNKKQPIQENLIECLSDILAEVTDLTRTTNFSDPVKFSLLPAVQGNLSSIRSRSGDCAMILNTSMPEAFKNFVTVLISVHLLYLPVYLGHRTQWDLHAVVIGSSLAFSSIAGFIIILYNYFRNPFLVNGFALERIVSNTFKVIEDCLDAPVEKSQTRKKQ